jgi:ANTAR domain-containing protein
MTFIPEQPIHVVPDSPSPRDRTLAQFEALAQTVETALETLETHAVLEQAKGMVMTRYGVPADQAYETLRRWASVWHLELGVLVDVVLDVGVREASREGPEVDLAGRVTEAIAALRS